MKYTPQEFLKTAKNIHSNKYNYPQLPKYLYGVPKIQIYCKKHDFKFEQTIEKHLAGQTGCKNCISEKKKKQNLTTSEFLQKAKNIHGEKYNYDKVVYINNYTKVKIRCNNGHGYFEMTPGNHTHKTKPQGCRECSGKILWTKTRFIKEAKIVHKNKYDYDKVDFIDSTKKVIIICTEHGEFLQTPQKHISGHKCTKCSIEIVSNKNRLTKKEFIEKAIIKHGNRFKYSKVKYTNNYTAVTIICFHHGEFNQIPSSHLSGSGCPICRLSKGEQKVAAFLEKNNVKFITQYKFDKSRLSYDFMFEQNEKKYLIEYNGAHHYEKVNYSKNDLHAEQRLKYRVDKDKEKALLAKKNKFKLLIVNKEDVEFKELAKILNKN